jgi:hypothetical protein
LELTNLRQSLGRESFRETWNSFEQPVAAAKKNQQQLIDYFALADNCLGHFAAHLLR